MRAPWAALVAAYAPFLKAPLAYVPLMKGAYPWRILLGSPKVA